MDHGPCFCEVQIAAPVDDATADPPKPPEEAGKEVPAQDGPKNGKKIRHEQAHRDAGD